MLSSVVSLLTSAVSLCFNSSGDQRVALWFDGTQQSPLCWTVNLTEKLVIFGDVSRQAAFSSLGEKHAVNLLGCWCSVILPGLAYQLWPVGQNGLTACRLVDCFSFSLAERVVGKFWVS